MRRAKGKPLAIPQSVHIGRSARTKNFLLLALTWTGVPNQERYKSVATLPPPAAWTGAVGVGMCCTSLLLTHARVDWWTNVLSEDINDAIHPRARGLVTHHNRHHGQIAPASAVAIYRHVYR